jgi:hypothetical protein
LWQITIEDEIRGTRRSWNEVVLTGNSSWMPYAPQGVNGPDDDDDDECRKMTHSFI